MSVIFKEAIETLSFCSFCLRYITWDYRGSIEATVMRIEELDMTDPVPKCPKNVCAYKTMLRVV